MYIDTHAHFDLCIQEAGFTEKELLEDMKTEEVSCAVQVATHTDTFSWTRQFSRKYAHIYFALGIHPTYIDHSGDFEQLSDIVQKVIATDERKKLLGIGEIGLDYYWMTHSREAQIEAFEKQLAIARAHDLYVIIHSRDAMEDTIAVLRNHDVEKCILHCFGGTKKDAEILLDMGYYISFAGNVTFKKATVLQEAAAYVPVDRILLETDCPYLAPVPKRGEKNKPDYVKHTYAFIADLKKLSLTELSKRIKSSFEEICMNAS
jgi:TatD DNase family protein